MKIQRKRFLRKNSELRAVERLPLFERRSNMAKKIRYRMYLEKMIRPKVIQKKSDKKSILGKLRKMKNQEFVMKVPIGDGNE